MDRAKMLLETSSVPIEQIVNQIGYSDPSAFARQFKRYTRFTPRGYRERYGLSQPSG
jgi:AraC-like DNA-binding protein